MSTTPVVDFTNNTPNLINNINSLIQNIVNQAVVTSGGSSISGFVFDIIGDEENSLDSEITDHYLEDNTAIQDHWSLRPERFTVHGFVGELTDILQTSQLNVLSGIQTLGTVAGLVPTFSAQASQVYNSITSVTSEVTQAYNQAQNFFNVFSQSNTTATKQQQAFSFFYNLWQTRQLCTVNTPYQVFFNMAIESVRALQRDDNKYVSDFAVTFKKIRFVSTTVINNAVVNPNGLSTTNIPTTTSSNITGRALDNALANNPSNLGSVNGLSTTTSGSQIASVLLAPPTVPASPVLNGITNFPPIGPGLFPVPSN